MPSIQNVKLSDIKHVLGYAVKNRRGYRHDIDFIDGKLGGTVDKFVDAGFIQNNLTLEHQTWNITNLGDMHYRDLFGNFDYYSKRLSGFLSRILKLN